MYLLLLLISILLFGVGLIMIFSAKAANWLNNLGNIVVITEKKLLEHRFYSGSISLLFGVFFMYRASGYQAVHTQILVVPFYFIGILLTLFGLLFFMSSTFFEKIALKRELKEEVGIDCSVGKLVYETSYHYPEISINIKFYQCKLLSGEPQPLDCAAVKWIKQSELLQYEFPPSDIKLIKMLSLG